MTEPTEPTTTDEGVEESDDESQDSLEQLIEDAKAAAKRIREAGTGTGKAINFPKMISGELIPMIVALAEEISGRDEDHEERIANVELALGAAGIGVGHPLLAMPGPSAVELLGKCRGLAEAFIHLTTAPTEAMKEQAKAIITDIDLAFRQAQTEEEKVVEEAEKQEVAADA